LRDLLRAAGCTVIRQGKGSHEIWHILAINIRSRLWRRAALLSSARSN
jgi:hypothetical protein